MCQAYEAEWSFVTWLESDRRKRVAYDLEKQCPSQHKTFGRCVLRRDHDGPHRNPDPPGNTWRDNE